MSIFKDIFYLFFPDTCLNCEKQLVETENSLCLHCRFDLPTTNFSNQKSNVIEQSFFGRVTIEYATALFYYHRKGIVQTLIHKLKYKGKQEIGILFGKWLGQELLESNRCPKFDYILPVPLHKNKLKKRGYNQVTKFGEQLSKALNIPYIEHILVSKQETNTQTLKKRLERWKNVEEKFYLKNKNIFKEKHILLIDDVITTGATMEACIIELQQTDQIKISIAAIAFTA